MDSSPLTPEEQAHFAQLRVPVVAQDEAQHRRRHDDCAFAGGAL